jgi:hypothetical protein
MLPLKVVNSALSVSETIKLLLKLIEAGTRSAIYGLGGAIQPLIGDQSRFRSALSPRVT